MTDMACIYEMNMVQESRQVDEDLLSGRAFDILLGLLDSKQTVDTLAKKLAMPRYSLKLYLKRLVNAGIVVERSLPISEDAIEKEYELPSDRLSIINNLGKEGSKFKIARDSDISAQHFAVMAKRAIMSAAANKNDPYYIGSYFMKASDENMAKFKKEVLDLFEKYKAMEDPEQDKTYSLFTVFSPFNMEDEENGKENQKNAL